jgi:hypothetical protein
MITRFIDRHQRWLFPAPAIIFVVLMMIFPLGYTLWNSFSGWSLTAGRPNTFIGPQNYIALLTDARFWNAVLEHALLHGAGNVRRAGARRGDCAAARRQGLSRQTRRHFASCCCR